MYGFLSFLCGCIAAFAGPLGIVAFLSGVFMSDGSSGSRIMFGVVAMAIAWAALHFGTNLSLRQDQKGQ